MTPFNWTLFAVQLGFIIYFGLDILRIRRWRKRVEYWRNLTIREHGFAQSAIDRGEYLQARQHQLNVREYLEKWQEALRK